MDYKIIVVIVVITVLITVAVMKLWPYIKDFKVTPEEKKKVEDILVTTISDVFKVAYANKTKEELILIISSIVMDKIKKEDITCFKKCEIEKMIESMLEKLQTMLPDCCK